MKCFILIGLILSGTIVWAQSSTYNVIKVNGEIFNVTQSLQLSQGNSLYAQDELNFKSNSFAYVISDAQKKYMLRTPNIESADGDIFANAELALSPIRSRGQLSTRAAMSETGVKDFKTYLGIDNFNVVGPVLEIRMDSGMYPLSNEDFFVFHYTINNRKVSKKVAFTNQTLRIERDKLLVSQGDTLKSDTIPKLSVYKYQPATESSELITEINLCFIDADELKKELETIVPVVKSQGLPVHEIKAYLLQYVFDIYGNVEESQVNQLIADIEL